MQRRRRRGSAFRRDIEGMRAVAILGVVLYHAHVGLLRGGFVGVDVFYVISGYLITGLLWRELHGERRISFRGFYARRIQRLLSMSFLVLAVTAVVAAHYLPPLQAKAALKDGVSAAFYVSNYRFAALQTSYLTAGGPPSPFQQYWSLSLEEQFYLVWPLLLLGSAMLWRSRSRRTGRRGPPSRGGATATLAVVGLASFGFGVWLTHANQPWAFFSLPARAWELAVGGLVAFATPSLAKLREAPAAVLGWAGLAVVAGSMLALSGSVPYPGVAALAPVLGTAAVIASGCASPRHGPVLLLARTLMRVIGRISYSWYLWHWPVLVLAPYVVGHALSVEADLALALASLVLAGITFVAVEDPLRRSSWLRATSGRVLRVGATLTTAGVATCVVSIVALPSIVGHGQAPVARLSASALPPGSPVTRAAGAPGAGGGQAAATTPPTTPNPYAQQLADSTAEVQQAVARSVLVDDVPANLTPTIAGADADEAPVYVDGCMDSFLASTVQPCQFGDTGATSSIVLFGDSHAGMWFPAVDSAANRLGLKLYTWTKATCPPLILTIISPDLGRTFYECDEWRQNVLEQIARVHPELVILGVARHYTTIYGFTPYTPKWLHGFTEMIGDIEQLGAKVMVMGPIPKPPFTVPGCLSVHLTSATACTVARATGVNASGMAAERSTVQAAGGLYVNTLTWLCTSTTCATVVDNLLAYRDDNHLTAAFADYLSVPVTDEIALALGIRPPPPTTSTTTAATRGAAPAKTTKATEPPPAPAGSR
jgi:peptidoglycan/LPS O-acetylase OafA/YrhL